MTDLSKVPACPKCHILCEHCRREAEAKARDLEFKQMTSEREAARARLAVGTGRFAHSMFLHGMTDKEIEEYEACLDDELNRVLFKP